MPASMMSAPVGSMPKVIGSSMVMVAIGPTPGSTPISVPMRQPTKHSARFLSDRATLKPSARLSKRSIMGERNLETLLATEHERLDGRLGCFVGPMHGPQDVQRIEGNRQAEHLLEQE